MVSDKELVAIRTPCRPHTSQASKVVQIELSLKGSEALHSGKVSRHNIGLETLGILDYEGSTMRHDEDGDIVFLRALFEIDQETMQSHWENLWSITGIVF